MEICKVQILAHETTKEVFDAKDIEMDIYKIEIKATDYPNMPIVRPLSTGDTFFIKDASPVRVGDWYRDYPAKVHQVFYENKKWWQFWKKKKQIGYLVRRQ